MKPMSNLSIIIPTRWATEYLKTCIESIKNYSILDNEIIIVADKPSWQTLRYLQENNLPYILTDYGHQFMAWNVGAQYSTREYIVIIGDDVVFGPDWDISLSEIANYKVIGNLLQYSYGSEFNFGYNGDIKSFNLNEFIKYGNEHKKNENTTGGISWPLTIHRDLFWKYGGFTFHTSRAQGHDIELVSRILTNEENSKHVKSLKSFIFHFGSTGNKDHIIYDHKDFGAGILMCSNCLTIRGGFGNDVNQESTEIFKKGFWLCDKCKILDKSNIMIKKLPMIIH